MLLLAVVLSGLTVAQDTGAAPTDRFALDGKQLGTPRAVISPLGWLEVTGRALTDSAAATIMVKLRFPMLEWPAAGEQEVGDGDVRAYVGAPHDEGEAVTGKLVVGEVGLGRVRFSLRYERDGVAHTIETNLPAELYVPKLEPTTTREFTPPQDDPQPGDIVFCVLGNGGTGLPGQHQVAASIAKLAPSGPLDFVVLLGNNFMPNGVTSERDPLFVSRFEEVYDRQQLAVPFYALPGPAEHRGSVSASRKYGVLNTRWTATEVGFRFEMPCHGKRVGVFGGDSVFIGGPIPDPRVRTEIRALFTLSRQSTADWKIICTYHQLVSLGGEREDPDIAVREARAKVNVTEAKADLLICAEGRGMRFVAPEDGIPQVMAGGGGGPEMGVVVEQVPGTEFAYGGGGSVWLRLTGTKLIVSFRDADGNLLYARELTKS